MLIICKTLLTKDSNETIQGAAHNYIMSNIGYYRKILLIWIKNETTQGVAHSY